MINIEKLFSYACSGDIEKLKEYYQSEVTKANENENLISADKLINTFTDMANRGTLLCGKNITQEDLLIQIIGTIVKVSMDL